MIVPPEDKLLPFKHFDQPLKWPRKVGSLMDWQKLAKSGINFFKSVYNEFYTFTLEAPPCVLHRVDNVRFGYPVKFLKTANPSLASIIQKTMYSSPNSSIRLIFCNFLIDKTYFPSKIDQNFPSKNCVVISILHL